MGKRVAVAVAVAAADGYLVVIVTPLAARAFALGAPST